MLGRGPLHHADDPAVQQRMRHAATVPRTPGTGQPVFRRRGAPLPRPAHPLTLGASRFLPDARAADPNSTRCGSRLPRPKQAVLLGKVRNQRGGPQRPLVLFDAHPTSTWRAPRRFLLLSERRSAIRIIVRRQTLREMYANVAR